MNAFRGILVALIMLLAALAVFASVGWLVNLNRVDLLTAEKAALVFQRDSLYVLLSKERAPVDLGLDSAGHRISQIRGEIEVECETVWMRDTIKAPLWRIVDSTTLTYDSCGHRITKKVPIKVTFGTR